MKKMVLIDGSSLIHRAFYALPLMNNPAGEYTNAVYGFMTMFNNIVNKEKADYLLVCFDKSRISFRNNIKEDYKGHRKETPFELKGQFGLTKEVLTAADVHWLEMEGYEADDLLGTYSALGSKNDCQVYIYSGDRDILQLIDDNVVVYLTKKGISKLEKWDTAQVKDYYDLIPEQLKDLKGLMGDASDNISGVPGVGEKTALKLLAQFETVEKLYQNIDQLENVKLRDKLIQNREIAETSKVLATIHREVPINQDLEALAYQEPEREQLLPVYQRLNFKSLLAGLPEAKSQVAGEEHEFQFKIAALGDVPSLIPELKAAGQISLAFNWKGGALKGDILDFAIGLPGGHGYVLEKDSIKEILQGLGPVFEDGAVPKITAHAKELLILGHTLGISFQNIAEDVILQAYLLDPSAADYKIEELALVEGISLPKLAGGEWVREACQYFILSPKLNYKLEQAKMATLYRSVELPLSAVLADMELNGVKVDGEELRALGQELDETASRLAQEIQDLAGVEFNVNSTKQLGEVLFVKLQIPPLKKKKTGYSTDSEVLEQLAADYPIAGKILDYRTYAKLKSTYAEGLAALINENTGKIHTNYKQTVTATGRLSSVEPNLQNIPIRLELGRRIRKAFKPSNETNLLLAGDYNQIELRVLAHISGDEKLIKAFKDNEDIHTRTAAEVFGIELDQVTPAQRSQAKAVNFGIVYGISDYGLAKDLGIRRKEAKEYIEKYFFRYPKVAGYQREIIAKGKADGYVETILGRRRYLRDLNSSNFNTRGFAQRMAMNTPIQGSAADIIKIAMLNIHREIKKQGLRSKMILQVHDELIFDLALEEKELLTELVRTLMEDAIALSVPLTVDMKIGSDWYSMEKLK